MGKNGLIGPGVRVRRGTAGFSLLEVALLSIFLLVAVGGLSGAVLSSLRLSRATEESAVADAAVRALAADMQTGAFDALFRLYNGDPGDDPGGQGTGPGNAFDVRGLTPRTDDPDGRVGRIVFPSVPTGGLGEALREDVEDARLGMPRDLNGDNDLLDDVGNGAYLVLPVRIVVEWRGAGGNRTVTQDFLLVP